MLQGLALMPVLLLLLLVVLLAAPVAMNFSFITKQGAHGYVRFSWLFGLIRFQTQFPAPANGSTVNKLFKPSKRNQAKKAKAYKASYRKNGSFALLKHSGFRRHSLDFLQRLFHATHASGFYLKLRLGLGDPADTGVLWAIMGPVSGLLRNLQSMQIELEPDFIDTGIEIESHGQFRIIPLQIIVLILVFLFSPTTIQAWRLSSTND